MRIAVYGGSFNPPHLGHAWVASWLFWTGRADAVWWVPAYDHAFDKALAPFALRLKCCEAVTATLGPWSRVEPIEESLPAPSYTIQTLDALAARYPNDQLRWVLGADAIPSLPLWKDWERLSQVYPPHLVGRSGYGPVVDAPTFPDISSTEIRERLRSGMPTDHLLFPGVERLIRSNATAFGV